MQRYVNPHPAMYPTMQQQVPQQQMPQVVMTPQGPMMVTPQGMMPIPMQQVQGGMPQQQFPQQQGMMAMHGGMQGQYPQQFPQQFQQGQQYPQQQFQTQQFPSNNQSVVQPNSRFGQPSAAMETPTQTTDQSNRYQTFQTPQQPQQQVQQQAAEVEEPTRPPLFIVTPTNHKFSGNEKFKMGVVTEAIKPINIAFEEGYVAFTCLEESVEGVIEVAYKGEDVRMVTVRNTIINNTFYRVDMTELVTNLLSKDTKNLYKVFKSAYTKTNDKHQINVLNSLNTLLTDVINDYLTVNSVAMITIESFYTDYNDLLKVLGSVEEELEEALVEYLDKYVADIQLALTNTPKVEKATQITEVVSVAYLDKLVQETGLDVLAPGFVQLDDSITNHFLKSIVAEVVPKINRQEFLLVTLDKSIFKFMVGNNADIYVKRFA